MWPFRSTSSRENQGEIAIEVGPHHLALAHISEPPQPKILSCRFDEVSDTKQIELKLKSWVDELDLHDANCNLVLSGDQYQLVQLESPGVPADELKSAVRWRLKDILKCPVDQAAIDLFQLPADAYRGRTQVVFVAAIEKALMQSLQSMIQRCGLQLQCIDIAEMAVRNIVKYSIKEQHSVGCVFFNEQAGFINFINNQFLYFTRRLSHNLSTLKNPNNNQIDKLILELQRSLDYFESQMGKGGVRDLFLTPLVDVSADFIPHLNENLAPNVQLLPLNHVFDSDLDNNMQAGCVNALGGALRTRLGS